MASLADIYDRIFRNTNYKYQDKFHMLDLINDALNMLVDGAKLKGISTLSVVADTYEYDKPSDFKAPYLLQDQTSPNAILQYPLISIGENAFGYAVEDKIYIKPTPINDTTLTLYYYKYATQLSDDADIPEIDTQYHDLLGTYATAQIMLIPDMGFDKGTADRFLNTWETGSQGFYKAMAKKYRLSRSREKVVW